MKTEPTQTQEMRPSSPLRSHRLDELNHHELHSSRTGEAFSMSAVLTDLLGFKDLFVHHEIILPGRRSSSPHAHSEREEMIFVLKGCVTVIAGDSSTEIGEGRFAGFQPGVTHVVQNDTEIPAQVLVIASNPPQDEVRF